jgi:hypothetical protein
MSDANRPAQQFRLGFVTATVWLNGRFFTTVISKVYREGDEWNNTDQLNSGDLMNAVRLLQRAEEWISEKYSSGQ